MREDYWIISPPRGEPRSLGDVGVRVRVQLSGRPSPRWSRALGARLTRELIGHPGATQLRVNITELVQGDEIVLEGVEDRETRALADAYSARLMPRTGHKETRQTVGRTSPSGRPTASRVISHSATLAIPQPQARATIRLAPAAANRCR